MSEPKNRTRNPSSATKEDFKKAVENLPKYSFENEHGERFHIHSNGITVFMSGDEVNMMVNEEDKVAGFVPLFNQAFSVWSSEELYKLGEALMELHKEKS